MYVCMCVCMYVCMYVRTYVCVYLVCTTILFIDFEGEVIKNKRKLDKEMKEDKSEIPFS